MFMDVMASYRMQGASRSNLDAALEGLRVETQIITYKGDAGQLQPAKSQVRAGSGTRGFGCN